MSAADVCLFAHSGYRGVTAKGVSELADSQASAAVRSLRNNDMFFLSFLQGAFICEALEDRSELAHLARARRK
jgi:hypothetical protein